jgi:hypothetical protein
MCESPIEVALGTAICTKLSTLGITAIVPPGKEPPRDAKFKIFPQHEWRHDEKNYRFDFVVSQQSVGGLIVECDGHDFHERTKEQAAYDRHKDRIAQIGFGMILRFTGSEIYQHLSCCSEQIVRGLERLEFGFDLPWPRFNIEAAEAALSVITAERDELLRKKELAQTFDYDLIQLPTPAEIRAAQTPNGGWTKEQLTKWNVPWPPPKGWRKKLVELSRM